VRVLVTGGAGFLGSHLCDRLRDQGHAVTCVDNFHTGRRDNVSGVRVVEHDVDQPFDFDVERIYHLASPASPPHYQADEVRTLRTNVVGTLNALELARARGARLLLASTSEVYGDPEVHPQRESYHGNVNPLGPRACYDEGKRAAETAASAYARQRGTEVRVARIFNTFGPRMQPDDGRVVSSFIAQALRGEPLTIFGDGAQTRSFCYVDDLVDGLVALMESDVKDGPVNLGNDAEMPVRDLAQKILALTGSRSPLVAKPLPADDPHRRRPDLTRARKLLGWQPRTPLEDGLRRTIEWFRLSAGT
jgi:UDP-glucuronate decarboxylase